MFISSTVNKQKKPQKLLMCILFFLASAVNNCMPTPKAMFHISPHSVFRKESGSICDMK